LDFSKSNLIITVSYDDEALICCKRKVQPLASQMLYQESFNVFIGVKLSSRHTSTPVAIDKIGRECNELAVLAALAILAFQP